MNPILAGYTIAVLALSLASLRSLRRTARHYRGVSRAALARTAELEEQVHRGIIVCEAKGPVRAGAMVVVADTGREN